MLGTYFSPLAPAAILLLSAFIFPVVISRFPRRWPSSEPVRKYGASGLVGLSLLSLLGLRLTYGRDVSGEGLELLSGWNFSTTESVAALMVRADGVSLSFLLVTLFLLLAVTLLYSESSASGYGTVARSQVTGWLVMGSSACLLFISANGLTLIYAIMAFDTVAAFHWLSRGHGTLSVARLFLGIFTAAGLILDSLVPTIDPVSGTMVLGLALWLRLGLLPYLELSVYGHDDTAVWVVYLGLSLAVGLYLALRVVDQPLPAIISWLAVVMMLLSGVMVWLVGSSPDSELEVQGSKTQLLGWLILSEALLLLLAMPLATGISLAYVVGLILSLVALWVTPALGRPRFSEGAWVWPYLPAVFATYSLIGLPFSMGWFTHVSFYESLFRIDKWTMIMLVSLAEALALSGLVRYWHILGQGHEVGTRRSMVGIVMMVPFLIPGLAPFILSSITRVYPSVERANLASSSWIIMIVLVVGATGLGYFRNQIIDRLNLPVAAGIRLLSLYWLFRWGQLTLDRISKAVLRMRVTIEGQHYIGWAILIALMGGLIILLR